MKSFRIKLGTHAIKIEAKKKGKARTRKLKTSITSSHTRKSPAQIVVDF